MGIETVVQAYYVVIVKENNPHVTSSTVFWYSWVVLMIAAIIALTNVSLVDNGNNANIQAQLTKTQDPS